MHLSFLHPQTEGCAGLTGIGLEVGQQILAISGKSLHGLKHKEAVIAIKNAFEGPINKVLEFVVLDPNASNDWTISHQINLLHEHSRAFRI